MNAIALALGAYLLLLVVQGSQMVSSAGLDNLTNVIDLTPNDFDQEIANNHLFVLFYESR